MIEDDTTTEKQTLEKREKRSWDNYEMDEPEYDDMQDTKNEDTTENSKDVKEAENSEKDSWERYEMDEPLYDNLQDLKDEDTTPNSTDGQEEDSEKECDECEEKENDGMRDFMMMIEKLDLYESKRLLEIFYQNCSPKY